MEKKSEIQYQQKKMEILQGFSELIADHGLENVSMAKLAKHQGIPTSLIFYYFKNKEQLVEEMVDYVLEVCRQASIYPLDEEGTSSDEERFLQLLEKLFLERESADSYHIRAYYVCYNLALRDKDTAKKFYHHQEQIRLDFREKLRYFAERGVVAIKDADEAAEMLFCLVNGLTDTVDFVDDEKHEMRIARRTMALFMEYLHFERNSEEKDKDSL